MAVYSITRANVGASARFHERGRRNLGKKWRSCGGKSARWKPSRSTRFCKTYKSRVWRSPTVCIVTAARCGGGRCQHQRRARDGLQRASWPLECARGGGIIPASTQTARGAPIRIDWWLASWLAALPRDDLYDMRRSVSWQPTGDPHFPDRRDRRRDLARLGCPRFFDDRQARQRGRRPARHDHAGPRLAGAGRQDQHRGRWANASRLAAVKADRLTRSQRRRRASRRVAVAVGSGLNDATLRAPQPCPSRCR
jgi:hypothetical protein